MSPKVGCSSPAINLTSVVFPVPRKESKERQLKKLEWIVILAETERSTCIAARDRSAFLATQKLLTAELSSVLTCTIGPDKSHATIKVDPKIDILVEIIASRIGKLHIMKGQDRWW